VAELAEADTGYWILGCRITSNKHQKTVAIGLKIHYLSIGFFDIETIKHMP
jgi:hypothetical protein